MPLPELNTNFLVQPIDSASSMAKAAQINNYLMEAKLAPIKAKREQVEYENALLDRERKAEEATMKKQTEIANRYLKITEAPSLDIAKKLANIYKLDISESDWHGNNITIADNENKVKISGPKSAVAEASRAMAEDPTWATSQPMGADPKGQPIPGTKIQHFMAWAAANGLSVERMESLETKITETKALEKAKADIKEKEFGQPYLDQTTGSLMQKNEKTGEVKKIATPPNGMVIESDGKGGFVIRTGVPGGQVTTKTKGDIEEKITSGKEQLARIQAIKAEFKPEFQEIGARLGAAWTGIKAKLGEGVDPKDAQFLTDFKKYQRKSIENINLYIKELTGAQMSEKEASRLRLAQPDPGEKWYQGDDPITFAAKLNDIEKITRATVARWEYYLSKGIAPTEIKKLVNTDAAISLEEISSRLK